jgi:hypothetical protein
MAGAPVGRDNWRMSTSKMARRQRLKSGGGAIKD